MQRRGTSAPAPSILAASRKHALGLIAICIGLGLAVAAYFLLDDSTSRREAIDLARTAPPDLALSLLVPQVERAPQDQELLQALVIAMQRAGKPAEEIEPFSARRVALPPDQLEALESHLRIQQSLNRPATETIPILERILALNPDDHNRRLELAANNLTIGRSDEALSHARIAAGSFSSLKLRLLIAHALFHKGDYPAASAELNGVLAEHPEFQEAILLQASVQQKLQNDAQAIELLNRLRIPDPLGRIPVLQLLGQSYSHLNREDEARKAFEELTRLQEASHAIGDANRRPKDIGLQLRAATAMVAAGMTTQAVGFVENALERTGPNRDLLLMLAECHERVGNTDKARSIRGALPGS